MKDIGRLILSATVVAVAALGLGSAPAAAQIPVRVTNTPLPITGAVTVGSPVTVGNAADSPVPTRDVDNPAEDPFEMSLCEGDGALGASCAPGRNMSPVPATSSTGKTVKRFVAEYVSGDCLAEAGTSIVSVELTRLLSNNVASFGHRFVPVVTGTGGTQTYQVFSQQVRLYYEPGESLFVSHTRVGPAGHRCSWTVSGYFVTQ